ncbi:WD-repeat protein [Reticulomyxa filosa]|uniref:WD-repeat protein n=1 Tax=Reticulomyxa filosa TaxID=46433 RepID=X6MKR6_RETFI|nr:WD-repeat protein [Reticulomyxa filosa]|eukprot:ETO14047.1 WD-repeat protein [Reticulomyxa filosa]
MLRVSNKRKTDSIAERNIFSIPRILPHLSGISAILTLVIAKFVGKISLLKKFKCKKNNVITCNLNTKNPLNQYISSFVFHLIKTNKQMYFQLHSLCLDAETSKSLHFFKGYKCLVWCVYISQSQSHNKNGNNKINNIIVIGGNIYTICSRSCDHTVRICDIETTKQLNVLKGHTYYVRSIKYRSSEMLNTILSGSADNTARLWDIRSGKQIQVFNGHTVYVNAVEYSPFVINDIIGNSNVICSGSIDNTIRFCDVRSNKDYLFIIKGDQEDAGVICIKFINLKKKSNLYSISCKIFFDDFRKAIHQLLTTNTHFQANRKKLELLKLRTERKNKLYKYV